MSKVAIERVLSLLALSGLFFSGCASSGRALVRQVSSESRQFLAAGEFAKAVDVFKEAQKRNPRDKELQASYMRTVEEIKRAADSALGRRDYAAAASICRVLSDNYTDFRPFAARLTFKKSNLDATIRSCRTAILDSQAQQELKAGNYAKALDLYAPFLKEYPRDADLAASCLRTLREIKAAGDKALADRNFGQSGKVNTLLLNDFPSFESLEPGPAFTRADLEKAIAACRENLTKAGLSEYRKGNLAKAIAVWEELLAFDPENAEIKRAVETAKTQLNRVIKKK
jgi:tetratricopeptide (TPR) repeat protein